MKDKYQELQRKLIKGFRMQSLIIIVSNIIALFIVAVKTQSLVKPQALDIIFVSGLELIGIVSIILGFYNFISIRFLNSRFLSLIKGIEAIADGDFDVRLDSANSAFLSPIYEDFNKMAAELQNTGILRTDFINSYSHEFKTPIVSINGFANLLMERNVSEEDRKKYLKIIADESARLSELANDTLLLSKLDSQQIIPDKKTYALDEQLRHCVILLSVDWGKKNIDLAGELSEVSYTGNEELMQHLWMNLLNNAIRYTPAGGEIRVSLSREENSAVIRVADNGTGMDEETVIHIFDKYYQGTAAGKLYGLGLGLSIAKRIVDLCGGIISVETRKNEGSTFTVRLPL